MREVSGAALRSSGPSTGRVMVSRVSIHPVLQLTYTSWNTIARVSGPHRAIGQFAP